MANIITTVHLTDIQKEVLCKISASPTPQVAYETLSQVPSSVSDNYATARDTLEHIGLISVLEGTVEVTDKGREVMRDENLIDDTDELTELGQQLADANTEKAKEQPPQQSASPEGMAPGGLPPMEDQMGGMGLESLQLMRAINARANQAQLIVESSCKR